MKVALGLLAILGAILSLAPGAAALVEIETAVLPDDVAEARPDPRVVSNVSAQAEADAQELVTFVAQALPLESAPLLLGPLDQPQDSAPLAPAKESRVPATVVFSAAFGLGTLAVLFAVAKGTGLLSALPFFSRIDVSQLLNHASRQRIHEAVIHNPGITPQEVAELLNLSWGITVYHLSRLEQERLVVSESHRRRRRYFKNGGGVANEEKAAVAELRDPTAQRLAAAVLRHPGAAQKEICEDLHIGASQASKHLARLEAAQLLTRKRDWKLVKYFPTPRLGALLPAVLPMTATV